MRRAVGMRRVGAVGLVLGAVGGVALLLGACGGEGEPNGGTGDNALGGGTGFGPGTDEPDVPYTPPEGRYGVPEVTFTLPAPAASDPPPALIFADLVTDFPEVDWDNLDRLYLPAGRYSRIQLGGLPERSAERPLVITNLGGQVHAGGFAAGHPMVIGGGANWVLTGRYDDVSKTGDSGFIGHAEGGFANSGGTYGILLDDEFSREGASGLAVGGFASDFEIEMIEIARAEFAGLLVKTDDEGSAALMRRVRLHDLYVHDVGSEGLYLGSTQAQPQHAFEELEIYDNRFLRAGTEALQVGQLGSDCEIHHNVLGPGAVRWRSAFADYQNGNVQYGQRYGSSSFHHNVVIGTGDLFVEFFPQPVDGDVHGAGDTVSFHDNYFADSSLSGAYTHADENSVTVRFEDNVWGGFVFDYDEVYPDQSEPGAVFAAGSNTLNPHFLTNNRYEADFPFIQWVFDSVTEEGNTEAALERVHFREFMGSDLDANYRQLEWWTDVVTRHPDTPARTYAEGDWVIHGGIVYRALQENSGQRPDQSAADWQKVGVPVDDVRLTQDSPHQGLGLRWPPP